jgi:hypothetical protein
MTRERLLTIALVIGAVALGGAVWFQRREIRRLRADVEQKDGEIRRLGAGIVVVREVKGDPATVLVAAERAGFDVATLRADLDDHGMVLRGVLNASASTQGGVTPPHEGKPLGGSATGSQTSIEERAGDGVVPWGRAVYDPAQAKPWTVEQYPRTYSAGVALAEREDGSQFAYVTMGIESQGSRVKLEPSAVELTTTPEPSRWRWGAWPLLTLDAGLRAGSFEWFPGVAVAFATRGTRAGAPEWTFLAAGLAYGIEGRRAALSFAPVSYTLRDLLPVRSTSVGPAIFVDERAELTYAVGLRVVF